MSGKQLIGMIQDLGKNLRINCAGVVQSSIGHESHSIATTEMAKDLAKAHGGHLYHRPPPAVRLCKPLRTPSLCPSRPSAGRKMPRRCCPLLRPTSAPCPPARQPWWPPAGAGTHTTDCVSNFRRACMLLVKHCVTQQDWGLSSPTPRCHTHLCCLFCGQVACRHLLLVLLHLFEPEELLTLQLIKLTLHRHAMACHGTPWRSNNPNKFSAAQLPRARTRTCVCILVLASAMCPLHPNPPRPAHPPPHLDVRDGVFNLGLDDILQRIDAPVGHLERRVERHEGRLQVGQLHQQLDGRQVGLAARLDLLAALAQAWRSSSRAWMDGRAKGRAQG